MRTVLFILTITAIVILLIAVFAQEAAVDVLEALTGSSSSRPVKLEFKVLSFPSIRWEAIVILLAVFALLGGMSKTV